MFGTYRFILVWFVVISHLGYLFFNRNFGSSAVISFFIISGYLTSISLTKKFRFSPKGIFSFYFDRLLRIFPMYLVIYLLTYIFLKNTSFAPTVNLGYRNLFYNVTIFPLNFYNLIPMTVFSKNNIVFTALLPQAWYLALELQFYLISPFLIKWNKFMMFMLVGSLVFWTMAAVETVNTDTFGYRLLPGVLYIFISGIICYFDRLKSRPSTILKTIWIYAILMLFYLTATKQIYIYYSYEVLSGLFFGLPIIWFLSKLKYYRNSKDTFLGELSYPIFLSHFLIIWIVKHYWPDLNQFTNTIAVIFLTILASLSLYYGIELPITDLRYRLRKSLR